MSILTRKLTEHELAAVENEATPVAHETFSQIFSVDRGQLEVLDPFSATIADEGDEYNEQADALYAEGERCADTDADAPSDEDDDTPPKPMGLTPAVVAWIATYGGTIGTLIYLAGGGR
ncbi:MULTISPECIES: hypothetical protein [Rhodococcus]|uniref:hypothetical protein n=1 Tax=Rhodococcus TaxID=1827 RepID=UPI001E62A763|nr:hypothetical protein [Rhodococcus pyridinivorans]MCD2116766.1 hypothetical protein [Rhodococcus pyridinivorans]MCZ4626026.1 hypothetical protein [Rhodococcus pyridinivorans]MCZ4646981.1 hypothetical protein [Rhodococcus pyridinivorans]MDJ0480333.1 hypothetical protein [Rhodococcus pyridinivorans]MDV7253085.1 hypothetical protein [Rhodococcus pyridinivorans]